MTTTTTDRARLEELLGEYWEIAFEESSGVAATGNKANRVLHEIRALFDALAAPATAPEKTVKEIMEFVRHYAANTFSSATLEDKIRRSLAAPAHQEQLKPGECWPERIMKQWDEMRDLISKGDKSSLPRDWFESLAEMRLIDAPDDRVKELEAEQAAARKAIEEENERWERQNEADIAEGAKAWREAGMEQDTCPDSSITGKVVIDRRDEPITERTSSAIETVVSMLEDDSDVLALASEFDSIIEAIGDDPASATAPDEQIRKDAERYRWCVKNNLVLAGGTREFGWQIAPVGSEWNRYIDSAMKGTP